MLGLFFRFLLSNRIFYLQIAANSFALQNDISALGKYLFSFFLIKEGKKRKAVFLHLIDESWHIYFVSRFS